MSAVNRQQTVRRTTPSLSVASRAFSIADLQAISYLHLSV